MGMETLPESSSGALALYRDACHRMGGFVGSHRYLHMPRDLPDVTSPALLIPFQRALHQFLTVLLSGD